MIDEFNKYISQNKPHENPYYYEANNKPHSIKDLNILDLLEKNKVLVKTKISKLVEATKNHAHNLNLFSHVLLENDFSNFDEKEPVKTIEPTYQNQNHEDQHSIVG